VLKEFREFIVRGNLVDLAVAVVIGTAFTAVVTSMVEDLITPLIAAIGGRAGLLGAELHNQRERVPLRRLHQRADRVPDRVGGAVLLRDQARERAVVQAADGAAGGGEDAPVPGVPERPRRCAQVAEA
jgi:hypothetical protein